MSPAPRAKGDEARASAAPEAGRRRRRHAGERHRPHGQALYRRQAGAARLRLLLRGPPQAGKLIGHAGLGNRKDIRNAVEAARKAAGWTATGHHNRAQILYYLAENLGAARREFEERIAAPYGAGTGRAARRSRPRSAASCYAAQADKFDGACTTRART